MVGTCNLRHFSFFFFFLRFYILVQNKPSSSGAADSSQSDPMTESPEVEKRPLSSGRIGWLWFRHTLVCESFLTDLALRMQLPVSSLRVIPKSVTSFHLDPVGNGMSLLLFLSQESLDSASL